MPSSSFIPRWQKTSIDDMLAKRRILLLCGARQSGKTTLARMCVSDTAEYRTLDDATLRQAAELDPQGFVKRRTDLMIIDEVQRVPELLTAVKKAVDENTRPGQYLLTGSAKISAMPNVRESLAGWVARIRLRPFSQGEIARVEPSFLDRAFSLGFDAPFAGFDRDAILEIAFRGGFPEVQTLSSRDRRIWHQDYTDAILERDLQDIARIRRWDAMRQLILTLAAWSSKFMDLSAIGSGLSIRRPTLETYLNALEIAYLVERVSPWTQTDYERVGKRAKVFLTDSGLLASLLKWHVEQIRFDPDRSGKLIETFAFGEIAAQVDVSFGRYELFHYRDREKREIDFLVQRDDGAILGIEIKAGSSVGQRDFRHLSWFQENLCGERAFVGIVLYTGNTAVSFGENLWAIPFGFLWA